MRNENTKCRCVILPHPLEATLKPAQKTTPRPGAMILLVLIRQEVRGHRRDQRARQEVRGQHRDTTASASGVNRKRATPVSSTTGKNTMQMESVPTRVGVAICEAPSRIATSSGLFIA